MILGKALLWVSAVTKSGLNEDLCGVNQDNLDLAVCTWWLFSEVKQLACASCNSKATVNVPQWDLPASGLYTALWNILTPYVLVGAGMI